MVVTYMYFIDLRGLESLLGTGLVLCDLKTPIDFGDQRLKVKVTGVNFPCIYLTIGARATKFLQGIHLTLVHPSNIQLPWQ